MTEAELAVLKHFASELNMTLNSYIVMAAIRYGMHLPRAVPLAVALRLGTTVRPKHNVRLDERLLKEVKAEVESKGRPRIETLIANQDRLDALMTEALPPPKAHDPGEGPEAYDFTREVQDLRPADQSPEGWQTLLDNLLPKD